MESTSSALGLMVIVALYIAIGAMSAAGSVYLSRLIFSAKQEQIFFGLFLSQSPDFIWPLPLTSATRMRGHLRRRQWQCFLSLVLWASEFHFSDSRIPAAWGVGQGPRVECPRWGLFIDPGQTTSVPLAYGFFCATYDVLMAAYFYTRQNGWQAAWSAGYNNPRRGILVPSTSRQTRPINAPGGLIKPSAQIGQNTERPAKHPATNSVTAGTAGRAHLEASREHRSQ